jgi:hypothetical protein
MCQDVQSVMERMCECCTEEHQIAPKASTAFKKALLLLNMNDCDEDLLTSVTPTISSYEITFSAVDICRATSSLDRATACAAWKTVAEMAKKYKYEFLANEQPILQEGDRIKKLIFREMSQFRQCASLEDVVTVATFVGRSVHQQPDLTGKECSEEERNAILQCVRPNILFESDVRLVFGFGLE